MLIIGLKNYRFPMPIELPELPSNFRLAEITKAAFMRMTSFQLKNKSVRLRYEIERSNGEVVPAGTIGTVHKKYMGLEIRFSKSEWDRQGYGTFYVRHVDFYAVDLLDEVISEAEDMPRPKLKLQEIR